MIVPAVIGVILLAIALVCVGRLLGSDERLWPRPEEFRESQADDEQGVEEGRRAIAHRPTCKQTMSGRAPHGAVSYAMRPRTQKPDLHREH